MKAKRSECPINQSLELLGDRWTLLVLRDMVFVGARRFRELLGESIEGISSNVLADRLDTLVEHGLLTRSSDAGHKQKVIYSLTEQAIELVPILIELGDWGIRHLPVPAEFVARNDVLAAGGPPMREAFMDELRETHLGPGSRLAPRPPGPSVRERIDAAYAAAVAAG